LGLEAEPAQAWYSQIDQLIPNSGPALFRLPAGLLRKVGGDFVRLAFGERSGDRPRRTQTVQVINSKVVGH
jgi:hypothetical protein